MANRTRTGVEDHLLTPRTHTQYTAKRMRKGSSSLTVPPLVNLSDPGIQLMLAALYEKETKEGKTHNCKETRKNQSFK